jgi:hypothetical protein
LADNSIRRKWEAYQRQVQLLSDYFKHSDEYELQTPTVAGSTATYKNDLSKLFFERVFRIADDGGYVAQVLPGAIFNGQSSKALRMKMLNEAELNALVEFENKGIFKGIDDRYRFGIVAFENGGYTEELKGVFDQRNTDILENFEEQAVRIPRRVLEDYSPEARIFPVVTSQAEVNVLNQILTFPSLGDEIEGTWQVNPLPEELNKTRDSDRFIHNENEADYPVYTGENIHQFHYDNSIESKIEGLSFWSVEENRNPEKSAKQRVREKRFNKGEPKKPIYLAFGGEDSSKSQKQFVNDLLNEYRGEPLSEHDVLLDCTEFRIAYRDVARATDERTLIATVLPKGAPVVHTVQTLRPYEIEPTEEDLQNSPLHSAYQQVFSDEELFCAVGLLNSIPFDFLMRTKVDSHIVKYKFTESQAPRLTEGDDWFEYIWTRAARLNCYGDQFEEMRNRLGGIEPATEVPERREVQAELDAAAFHAYGLDRDQTAFVLEDFHRVRDPRLMDEAYFQMVLEKYDDLAS